MNKIKRILIIEDEKQICDLLGKFLSRNDFIVLKALDGEQGLRLAQQEIPDLILLDIKMVAPDGIEVCHHLKHDPRTQDTVIFLFTAKAEFNDHRCGMAAGADAYLTKPILPAEILRTINRFQTEKAAIGTRPLAPPRGSQNGR